MTEHKKNYNEGRKAHSMPLEISRTLELVKDEKKFKSIGDTVQYLLNLESDLQKSNKIVDRYKCKKCGRDTKVTEEMALDLHKFRHRNCKSEDPNDKDCDGTLWHTYGLKDKANGTTDAKDKNARQKTQEEIEKEEWENNPINPKNYKIDPNTKQMAFSEIGKEQVEE